MQRRYDELREAVITGEAAEVEKVLARGTWDLNALDIEGHTALHSAIFPGYLEVVRVLLAHGADPNVRTSDGLPALNIALDFEMRAIVDVLLGHGAKLAAVRSDNVGAPLAAAWLVYTDRDSLRAVPLTPPAVVIGRDPVQCDVAIQDFGLSRRHARIDVRPDGQMTLTDLKSKGGCQVNRVSVVEAAVAVSDRLLLGKVEFVVVASLPAATRVVESATPGLRELSALAARPGVTFEEKLAWIDGICARVAAAHEKGVVHGDLNDRRIRAVPDGRVEVDFSPKSVPLPSLSPEQLRGRPADARSDVFAAACIAYQLLAGRPPFEGETLHAVTYRVLHEDPPDPRQLTPSLPEALAAWLQRGLAKEPAERFADGGEMLEALRRVPASGATKIHLCAQCGQPYRVEDNRDGVCTYHPGRVMDYDRLSQLGPGLPGDFWDCCGGTVETTALDVPGCARGAHVEAAPGDPGPFKRDLQAQARREAELAGGALTRWPVERAALAERRTVVFLRGTGDPGPIQGRQWGHLLADVRILEDDRRPTLLALLSDPQYAPIRRHALAPLLQKAPSATKAD